MTRLTPIQILVHGLADTFPDCEEIRERDLPAISDAELALVINADEAVGEAAFSASAYAEILDSALYLTTESKAAAYWCRMRIGAMAQAREYLAGEVTDELLRRMPADEPDMPATLSESERAGAEASL